MTLGELTQVLAGKCDGRERHLRQTKLGCGGEGTGVACMQVGGSCQHWEAGEPPGLTTVLTDAWHPHARHTPAKRYTNLYQIVIMILLLGSLLLCARERNYKMDTGLAKVRQWPNDGLRKLPRWSEVE